MLLVGLLDVIDAFPEPFSIVPNEICRLQGLRASECAWSNGICGGSFLFSHPDKSTIIEKIIAMNVKRSGVFMGLTRIEQSGNLRDEQG